MMQRAPSRAGVVAGVEQVGHAVQGDGCSAATGDALHDEHLPPIGADEVILVLLERADDVVEHGGGGAAAGEDLAQEGVGVDEGGRGRRAGRQRAGSRPIGQAEEGLLLDGVVALEVQGDVDAAVGALVVESAGAAAGEEAGDGGRANRRRRCGCCARSRFCREVVGFGAGAVGGGESSRPK